MTPQSAPLLPAPSALHALTASHSLTVIVPVLNEATRIKAALDALVPLINRGAQIVVVDGGSTDATAAIVSQFASQCAAVTLTHAPSGRAAQMNAGAQLATAKHLLFLHADTHLPPHADALVSAALASGPYVWGRFDVHIEGRSRWLRVIAAMMNTRSRITGIATGDQALFMTQAVFTALQGYAAQPLMEDIELSQRLRKLSRPACLKAKVVTSGRRWETRGVWRTVLLMWRLRFSYWCGTQPEQLAQLYR